MVEIICGMCNKKVSKENKVRYSGGLGYRKLCKPCRNQKSKEYGRKKAEALKMFRRF